MNKAELADAVAAKAGLSKAAAERAIDTTFETITRVLKKGDKVVLVGFGTFVVRRRAARIGRNPKNGAPIRIAAARMAAFKAGKGLKDSVN